MSIFQSLSISGSALTANRLKLDVISSNIANANTTRGRYVNGEWQPYRRKMVEVTPNKPHTFTNYLQQELSLSGVRVNKIVEDTTPFQAEYDPSNPDSNKQGYVMRPNVDVTKEMVDLMSTSRAYEANITAFNAGKSMLLKALEIGR
ncbi:flagellar basal body rod protein FlgC [Neobacillus mesonae]|uniref:Flagellar basal-body rod protein FlgC n=1 Tax=Neobacillus mesonae TaxID=1193713 RepID=A0A3T0I4E3_9BACI|nr:flagellar basal body rod protein FlgC [Neobacillus mesonae]AZU64173.1 flagellar basal body rod protein FlgC [Neobacillus mesonae]MED4203782.1 flagellar basal body rod protein FlgC [Neobacillus mesonae]